MVAALLKITILNNLILIMFMSCEFKASPYTTQTPKIKRNETNIELINANEPNVASTFKIAFLSDTHNYYDQLNKAVKSINQNGPYAFVVVNGDITNYGLLEEFDETRKILNGLSFPYLVGVGNHDLLSNGDKIFLRMFGATDYSVVYKNVHLVFFNNNNWETSGVVPNRSWVETELMASTSQFRLLIAHVSPVDRDRFEPSISTEWETLVTTYGVDYFLNGHNHNPQESSFAGATQITIGSPSKGSYYELTIGPGGISHQKISF